MEKEQAHIYETIILKDNEVDEAAKRFILHETTHWICVATAVLCFISPAARKQEEDKSPSQSSNVQS